MLVKLIGSAQDENLRVNNMDHTAVDKDIGNCDLGTVDGDFSVVDADGELTTLDGLELLAILELGGVANGVRDNVVSEDVGQLLLGRGGGELAESLITGGEDGDFGEGVNSVDETGGLESLDKLGKLELGSGQRHAHGGSEDGVDDVSNTTSESNILQKLLVFIPK